MMDFPDRIELVLPLKAEYVSVARLAVSGIANRVGFDIEVIEDIKVAVAEVCNKLVNAGSETTKNFTITFVVMKDRLVITFDSSDEALKLIFNNEDDELGIAIINAFMDDVEHYPGCAEILSMTKAFEGITTDGK